MLSFTGCLGYPSLTIAPDFSPLQLLSVPGFSMSLTSINLSLATSGGFYEFPFKFTAVDVATQQDDAWVGQCISEGYNFLPARSQSVSRSRPSVPASGQPREVAMNVTPVSTGPVPSYQFGAGAMLEVGLQFDTASRVRSGRAVALHL